MQAVMLEVPEALLVERRKLGHDRFDEMWEGVLHMVTSLDLAHQQLETWLVYHWTPLAEALGMQVTVETGVFDPAVAGDTSYRRPDVAVWSPAHVSARGIEGRAELVVEIRSPNDESYQKLPFYERVGVQEFLAVELDSSARRWVMSEGRLVEVTGDGQAELRTLPVTLRRSQEGALVMKGPSGVVTYQPRMS
jgi:Uma2 family endonuclease